MRYAKHKNGTECFRECFNLHRPRKVTAKWPVIGPTIHVYRLDFECGRGYKYYYFGQSYDPYLRETQHFNNLKRPFARNGLRVERKNLEMTVLKTFTGSDSHAKSIYFEHKYIWNHMRNKKGWAWMYDNKTDIPRLYNKESFTFRGWIRDNKPKVYENVYLTN